MTTLLAACLLYIQSVKSECQSQYQADRAVCQCLAASALDAGDALAKAELRKCYDKAAFARTACMNGATKEEVCP